MSVRRVGTAASSHIEPPLEPSWSDLHKLRWRAAVLHADRGVTVTVAVSNHDVNGIPQVGFFNVRYPGGSVGPLTFRAAWDYMGGIEIGLGIKAVSS